MSTRRVRLTCGAAVLSALAFTLPVAPATAAKVKVRTATVTKTISVKPVAGGGLTLDPAQRISATCSSKERALSVGILDSPRPLIAQSFGPRAVSQFVVGAPGRARVRLQVLCARGASISTRRVAGRLVPGGGSAPGTSTATVKCRGGGTPLAAPLSAEYAPNTGSFTSMPEGKNGWLVRNTNIPSTFPLLTAKANYADVNCLSKRSVSRVSTVQRQVSEQGGGGSVTVECPSGTRALGWGATLAAYARFSSSTVGGGFTIPYVKRAELAGRRAHFTFAVPGGGVVSPGLTPTHTASVTCGKLL